MGKRSKRRSVQPDRGAMGSGSDAATPAAGPFHNPFGALGGLRDELPPGEAPAEAGASAPSAAADEGEALPTRAILRRERKGRRGKEVTCVELRGLDEAALPAWLDDLKRGLGCGGVIEDGVIVLQGDQRERGAARLEKRGVPRVTTS